MVIKFFTVCIASFELHFSWTAKGPGMTLQTQCADQSSVWSLNGHERLHRETFPFGWDAEQVEGFIG